MLDISYCDLYYILLSKICGMQLSVFHTFLSLSILIHVDVSKFGKLG
jgi:hypothetical protein